MKFQPNDVVELLIQPRQIQPGVLAHPGCRGTVIGRDIDQRDYCPWYVCEFDGQRVTVAEDALRNIPPDPGRELVRWDRRFWRAPRNLEVA
jgi:hypothetical protein